MVPRKYLKPTYFIDCQSEVVVDLAKKIDTRAQKIVDIVKLSFNYVRDEIQYTVQADQQDRPAEMKASATLLRKNGFCIPKAVALAALLRANAIPTRLHFADIVNHRSPQYLQELMGTNVFVFHGYTDVFLNNRWIKLTPAFDIQLCKKHNLPVCTFNGADDAIFSTHDNAGNPFVEYVKDRGVYADLPFQTIFETFERVYGNIFR